MRTFLIAFVSLFTLATAAADPHPNARRWEQLTATPVPDIGPMLEVKQLGQAIQGATHLSHGAKKAAAESVATLERDFDHQLGAIISVLERGIAVKQASEREQDAVIVEGQQLEARRPRADASEGEIAQFNAQVAAYNAKLTDVHEQIARSNETFTKEMTQAMERLTRG